MEHLTLTTFFKRSLSQTEIEDMEHDYTVKLYRDPNFDLTDDVGVFAYTINGSSDNLSRFLEFNINKTDTDLHINAK